MKKEYYNDVHSITEEEKLMKRMNSDLKPTLSEKRSSIRILDSFEMSKSNSQSSNHLKKFAITKSILNRLKESKGGDESGITTKTPFDFNTFSKAHINSFYKKTAFLNSFHKDDSSFTREDSIGRKNISANKSELSSDQPIKNQQIQEMQKNPSLDSTKNFPIQDSLNEDIPTAHINEFLRETLSLSQKLKTLNDKSYKFLPSFQSRQSLKLSQ